MTSTTEKTEPRVWIGCLAAYNAGKLHGEWVDAAVEEDEIWAAQKRVLATSPEPGAEEHFIADHEGFGPYRVGEYESLTRVALVARMIDEHGPAFAAWLSNDDSVLDPPTGVGDVDELEESFRDCYRGEWESERAFAEDLVGDCGLPYAGYVYKPVYQYGYEAGHGTWAEALDALSSYLDWDAITRDVMMDCWTSPAEGGNVYVFANS